MSGPSDEPQPGLISRAVFIALHASLATVLVAGFLWPIQAVIRYRQNDLAGRRAVLARTREIVDHAGTAEALVRQVRDRNAIGGLLAGADEGTASAALQAQLKSAAEAEGARVRLVRALPARAEEGGLLIGARLEVSGPISAVMRSVWTIENGQTLLIVTAANLRSRATGRDVGRDEPTIDADLDVYGGLKDGSAKGGSR